MGHIKRPNELRSSLKYAQRALGHMKMHTKDSGLHRKTCGWLWKTPGEMERSRVKWRALGHTKRHMEDTEVHWKLYRGLWGCCFTQDLSACWQCQPGRARKASSLGSGTGEDAVLPLQLWDQVPKEKMGLGTHPVHHANFLHLSG